MALKALDIYKILPKKNCKECGFPTCLTFAMKLASGKADAGTCPYLDEATRQLLKGATQPPIRRVKIGVGERSFAVGEEIVLFRHDKSFVHPPGILFQVSDRETAEEIRGVASRVKDEVFPRIGELLRVNGIAIRNDSGSAEAFGKAVRVVEETAEFPEVLIAGSPTSMEAALAECGNYRPLIHAATAENLGAMCTLAKRYGAPLAVRARGIDALRDLAGKCAAAGVPDLVLDPAPETLGEFLQTSTLIRRRALARSAPELGYPVYLDATVPGREQATLSLGILKYAGVMVTTPGSPASLLATLTLRQNIYTDPQKPIQMTPGIYRVGNPARGDPLLLTVNFSLTYFTLLGYLEASRISCFLLLVDTEGFSVLTAVASGKLNETMIRDSLQRFSVEAETGHRTLVLPGYAAPLSGRVEEATGWKVLVGPRDAAEVPEFLEQSWKKTSPG
ncbi:MAG: acetyl-CoA decarbonylase/synthase complex subunit gamma [Methanomicrobiales archaeon]|nr:acetyl-CoA decarbonylase/synthase complex subunit gamma [Methanomicrobiales archaeon]